MIAVGDARCLGEHAVGMVDPCFLNHSSFHCVLCVCTSQPFQRWIARLLSQPDGSIPLVNSISCTRFALPHARCAQQCCRRWL